mgnify:CR=1 FL=1
MRHSIIIDNKSLVAWHRRVFTEVSTAALWVFWISLWKPVIHYGLHFSVAALISMSLLIDDRLIMFPLMGLTMILTVWGYGFSSSVKPVKLDNVDYAEHFDLPEENLLKCKNSKVCVVHHDEHGKIINIEAK